uniref:G-protein coupled receptors family 1 profile domain-containing protein n=1 Tax=Nannospalax galili TaxID=1026970 RepID=A0A8C6QJ90_NANGA
VNEFVLLGLTQDPAGQRALFVIPFLGSPMYFFLACLLLLDAVYCNNIPPKLITDLLRDKKAISFTACMVQIFVQHLFGGTEVFLVAMAYDCYVAICKPLHYLTIMNQWVCILLLVVAWTGVIDHFMCDMYPLLELACIDTYFIDVTVVASGRVRCIMIFILLLISYGIILKSLKTNSQEGRRKALSTCSSHITVVVCLFVSCIFMYSRPVSNFSIDESISVFYAVITPI